MTDLTPEQIARLKGFLDVSPSMPFELAIALPALLAAVEERDAARKVVEAGQRLRLAEANYQRHDARPEAYAERLTAWGNFNTALAEVARG